MPASAWHRPRAPIDRHRLQHPNEPVTWERRTHYDEDGHAIGYEVRVSGADGKPIDLSNGNRDSLTPNDDGWVLVED